MSEKACSLTILILSSRQETETEAIDAAISWLGRFQQPSNNG